MKTFKPHPAAMLLPPLSDAEIDELAADILEHGQRFPGVVTKAGLLLDGRHRQEACQRIDAPFRTEIWKGEVDGESPTAYVISANDRRRHMNASQRALLAIQALKLFEAEARQRQRDAGGRKKRPSSAPGRSANGTGKAAAALAAATKGVGTRTIERAKSVIARAPVAEIEKIRKGEKTFKQVERETKRSEQREQIKVYIPPKGKFQVITSDFSWKYRDQLDGSDAIRGAPPYPPMTTEEIIAFVRGPLADCCDEVCLYGAWVTNPILLDLETWPKVQAAIEGLGFRPVKLETWRKVEESGKPFTGLGNGVRNDTEQLVLFARGTVLYNDLGEEHGRPLQRTCFDAPIGEHSEKPALAYERLEQLVPYTSRLEMFSRAPRPGWVTSGSELPAEPLKASAEKLLPRFKKSDLEIHREMANAPPVEGRDFVEMPPAKAPMFMDTPAGQAAVKTINEGMKKPAPWKPDTCQAVEHPGHLHCMLSPGHEGPHDNGRSKPWTDPPPAAPEPAEQPRVMQRAFEVIAWQPKKHPLKVAIGTAARTGRKYAIDKESKVGVHGKKIDAYSYRWFCTTDGASSLHNYDTIEQAQAFASTAEEEYQAHKFGREKFAEVFQGEPPRRSGERAGPDHRWQERDDHRGCV